MDRRVAHCKSMATHGMHGTPEYRIWVDMRRRCRDKNRHNYYLYGGKGIIVCSRWGDFSNFYLDMGPRPSTAHSIERIDSNGNYEPGNCCWATPVQQANNRSTNHIVEYGGERMTLIQAVRKAGNVVKKSTALKRLKIGWSVPQAVETVAIPNGRY